MGKYIAFHRAINVSGTKIIKMQYLRELFEGMGYKNVATYIQSGNVYFETSARSTDKIASNIEKGLKKELGFEVETFVRTVDEMAAIADNDPFREIEDDGNAVVYVGFLAHEPDKGKAELLQSFNNDVDACKVIGTEIYILRYRDRGKAKFENKLIEGKLKQQCTTRNRKTVYKLLDLYKK